MSKRTDDLAREAARLLEEGKAADLRDASRQAAEARGMESARSPSAKRVRQHAQAIEMQSMGEEAYLARIREWLELAEDLMTTLEQALPGCETALVGRAAESHFDGDPAIHIRLHSPEADIGEIARILSDFGYDASEAKFPAMESRHGRLSQMKWLEESGIEITLTRCARRAEFEDRLALVTGKPVARVSLNELRVRLKS
jgi:hypothetical protein